MLSERQKSSPRGPRSLGAALVVAASLLATTAAVAQPNTNAEYVPEEEQAKSGAEEGVDGMLSLSANINLASNKDVVGQPDGFSTLFGLGVTAGLDYIHDRHELRNTIKITESFARTPALEQFVKNSDSLELESLYNYFLASWTGAYGQLRFEAPMFTTNQVTQEPTDYVVQNNDDSTSTFENISQFELSGPFQPTSLFQSVGWFAEPIRKDEFHLSGRFGFGGRETFADGVIAIDDDPNTEDVVEAQELETVLQGGLEAFLGAKGTINEGRISYNAGLTGLLPLLNNDPQDRSATELFRVGVTAGLTFNAFDWLSADYNLKVLRDPQLIDKTQVHNSFLITFKYALIERGKGSQEKRPPTLEEQLDKAREKEDEAEEEVQELEQKLEEQRQQKEKEADEAKKQAEEAEKEAQQAKKEAEEAQRQAEEADDTTDDTTDETGEEQN